MRLNFSVLWFDDSEDYFDSLDLEPLRNEVSSWGFSPDIKPVTTPTAFRQYSPFKTFDLIVVDQNLEQYDDGQEFIAELRDHAIYTEVIFYTSGNASALWDAVREKQLEGVFVSHRQDILSKIAKVGRQSIRKVLDLENMRGIVMAEVGELDHRLDEIIRVGMASLSGEQQTLIFEKFHKAGIIQNEDSRNRLDAFSKNPGTEEMIDLCDSNKRWQNYNRLRKCHNRLRKCHDKLREGEGIGDYEAEVLDPRNALAHGKPEPHQDGGDLFIYRGKKFHFNDDASLELRQTILKYKKAFSEIYVTLENEQ